MTLQKKRYRTLKSIDDLFGSVGVKSELDMLTLINYSLECKGTLRYVMSRTKVWRKLIRDLQRSNR